MENKKEIVLDEKKDEIVLEDNKKQEEDIKDDSTSEVIEENESKQEKLEKNSTEESVGNVSEDLSSETTESSSQDEEVSIEKVENDKSEEINTGKINIKESILKAADQLKETDVYGQIKKTGLYTQVKEMFIKIRNKDFNFTFSKRDQWIALGIILFTLFFDQLTKIIASNLLMEYESYEIIDHFFYFTFIYNPGMAWGTFEGMRWLFVIITPLILLFILRIFVYSKKHEVFTRAGMILVFAGAIGNWIDRLIIGEVRDFIHFIIPIIEYDFPIFNIADIAVVVGMGLVVLEVIIQEYQIWKLSKSL